MSDVAKDAAGPARSDVDSLLAAWGLPIEEDLLVTTLTHRSFANELGDLESNERLEFLGDAVLAIVVTEELFRKRGQAPESELAHLRTTIVSRGPLARVARNLGLGEYVLLGVGENRTGGRDKDSILSDTLEALIGATYLSHGLDKTRELLLDHLQPVFEDAGTTSATLDWKTPLRELLDARAPEALTFEVEGQGPDHDRRFHARVYQDDRLLGEGEGRSKKRAENAAAQDAYDKVTAAKKTSKTKR